MKRIHEMEFFSVRSLAVIPQLANQIAAAGRVRGLSGFVVAHAIALK
jgi:hypothetical protein